MTRIKALLVLFMAFVLLFGVGVQAGPTAIRDDRITDLAVTPALGRGYSIATSTFQSKCLDNVVTTKPSYNFRYKFEQMEEDGTVSSNVRASSTSAGSRGFFGFSINRKRDTKTEVKTEDSYSKFRILVTIEMDVYYASVDESKTSLAQNAEEILKNDDIPGFFDSCGPYYVRSIGRYAKFISMFTYQTKSKSRDASFESSLELSIKGWGQSASSSSSISTKLSTESSKKRLTIDTAAWGLGKDRLARLISYDLKTFKSAIHDAFLSMMDERTGMVTSIEVVPWVENTEFQKTVKLKDYVGKTDGKEVNVYMQKRIMNMNAEFLAEMDRATRNRLNIYYKARMCNLRIKQDYFKGNALDRKYKDRLVINNRTGKAGDISLTELSVKVNKSEVANYQSIYEKFVYGGDDSKEGGDKSAKSSANVQQCMDDLKVVNFRVTSYRDVASCRALETQFTEIIGRTVDDYCMPRLSGDNKK